MSTHNTTLFLMLALLTLLMGCSKPAPEPWVWNEMVSGDDIAWAITEGPDGSWVVGGLTHPGDRRDPQAHAVKLDPHGALVWKYSAEHGLLTKAKAIAAHPSGGYVLAGYVVPKEAADDDLGERSDAIIIRIDEDGQELWTTTWGEDDQDVAMGVDIADNGDILIAGTTRQGKPKNRDAFLMRLNDDGRILWWNLFGGAAADRGLDVAALPDGRIAMTGRRANLASHQQVDIRSLTPSQRAELAEQIQGDGWLVIADKHGKLVSEHTYGDSTDEAFNHVEPTADGGFILAGYLAEDESHMYTQAFVVKVDAAMNEQWRYLWGHPRWTDEAEVVKAMGDGYVVGGRATFNVVDGQHLLLYLSADGQLLQEEVWGTAEVYDQIYDLIPLPDGQGVVWAGSMTVERAMEDEFTAALRLLPEGLEW